MPSIAGMPRQLLRESYEKLDGNMGSVIKNKMYPDEHSMQVAHFTVAVKDEFIKRDIKPAPMAKITSAAAVDRNQGRLSLGN